ncbi:MAG: class I adenylate-forming enzyme family protein [Myxococcota bacterium]
MSEVLHIGQVLASHAALYPNKVGACDLTRSLTYRDWNAQACRLANAMTDRGVRKGDRVAMYAFNRLEWLLFYTACAKNGAVAVPVNFRLAGPEVVYQVQHSGAKILFVDVVLCAVIDAVRSELGLPSDALVRIGDGEAVAGWLDFEVLCSSASDEEPSVSVRPEDTWTLMYTSGTTGRPKGAIRSHGSYAQFWQMNAIEFGFSRSDKGLCVMPLAHVNSVFYGFVFTWLGATTCIYDRASFDPGHMLETLSTQRITFTSLTPTHYIMMLGLPAETRDRFDVSCIGKLLISSAPARSETKQAIMQWFRSSVLFEAYGSTEAGLVTLLRPEDQFTKLGSIGREVVGSARIRLLDGDRREVPDGEVGEVFSCAPTTFDGYWNDPQASAAAFDGAYCTAGDLARRDADGYYNLVDRKSNVIITGGEKVFPSEVEQLLVTHPAVKDAAVIGTADDKWGEAVTGVVVLHAGSETTEAELIRHVRPQLAGYKCPKRILFIDDAQMPRTATGKIQHRELRQRHT